MKNGMIKLDHYLPVKNQIKKNIKDSDFRISTDDA